MRKQGIKKAQVCCDEGDIFLPAKRPAEATELAPVAGFTGSTILPARAILHPERSLVRSASVAGVSGQRPPLNFYFYFYFLLSYSVASRCNATSA